MACQHRDRNVPTITGEGAPCNNPEVIPGWCIEHAPTHRCFFNLRSRSRCTAQSEPGRSFCRDHLFVEDLTRVKSEPPPPSMVEVLIDDAADLDELKEVLKRHFRGEL